MNQLVSHPPATHPHPVALLGPVSHQQFWGVQYTFLFSPIFVQFALTYVVPGPLNVGTTPLSRQPCTNML